MEGKIWVFSYGVFCLNLNHPWYYQLFIICLTYTFLSSPYLGPTPPPLLPHYPLQLFPTNIKSWIYRIARSENSWISYFRLTAYFVINWLWEEALVVRIKKTLLKFLIENNKVDLRILINKMDERNNIKRHEKNKLTQDKEINREYRIYLSTCICNGLNAWKWIKETSLEKRTSTLQCLLCESKKKL